MGFVSGTAVFFMIWWTSIFVVLPWGLKRDERGMPVFINMKKKMVITTVITIIIWLAIDWMIKAGFIDFRGMAGQMMQQDYGQ